MNALAMLKQQYYYNINFQWKMLIVGGILEFGGLIVLAICTYLITKAGYLPLPAFYSSSIISFIGFMLVIWSEPIK